MRTLKYVGIFLLWNLVISAAAFFLPPLAAIPVVALAYGMVVHYAMTERPQNRRRRALLRMRPLRGESLRWTLLAVPVLLTLAWGLESIYLRLVPVPTEALDPFGPLLEMPYGSLTIAILAVGIAPVVEEVFFRGLIQGTLERRLGVVWGIGVASALFAAIHLLPWVLPLHMFLGVAFGFAVYATRSLWAGVLLHTANNAAALLGMAAFDTISDRMPTVWEIGPTADLWSGVAMVAIAIPAAVVVCRRLWWAGRPARSLPRERRTPTSYRRQGGDR